MADKQTVIGAGTIVAGEIRGDESLLVKGRVEGKIHIEDALTIDAGAIVQADVDVKTLVVSGVLVGNVRASESVRLSDKSRVVGDIVAPRVAIDAGAAYRGRVEMGEAPAAARSERAASARESSTAPAVAKTAPPRLATPGRVAQPVSAPATLRAPTPPARAAAVVPSASHTVRVDQGAQGPAWARKKVRRR